MISINIIVFIVCRYKTLSGINFWKVKAINNNIQFIDLTIIIIQRWKGGIPSLIISASDNKILFNSLAIIGFEINENINIKDAKIWITKYRKINFLLFILINVKVINMKLLISIMNQIIIILVKVSGIKADKIVIGRIHKFENKLIINLLRYFNNLLS